jgi:NAD(P)H-dependent flavin oxidoreductase YrpB (nitropropane dioxygenase family)
MFPILSFFLYIVVQFFAPAVSYPPPGVKAKINVPNIVKLCQSYGCKVVAQVGSVKEGIEALDAGVDCLVVQGSEAGGQVNRSILSFELHVFSLPF